VIKAITVYCTYLRVRRLNKFTENNTFHTWTFFRPLCPPDLWVAMASKVSAVSLHETVHFSIHIWKLVHVRHVILQIKLAMNVRYSYK